MINDSIMVVFGGTGDLTYRKLLPAIENLYLENKLPESFCVVAVGRRAFKTESYREEIDRRIGRPYKFADGVSYYELSFDNQRAYEGLNNYLCHIDDKFGTKGNRLFYFATAPKYFEIISNCLSQSNMLTQTNGWQRIMIEKPFGYDLKTAKELNKVLCETVTEKNIYRIDHYLGKEMLQNILYIRFSNMIFERIWHKACIDSIQITVSENIGIEGRGRYYDQSGALRDMVQNHLFQMLALLTMERPSVFDPDHIRDEKVKIFKSLVPFDSKKLEEHVIFGQYSGNDGQKGYLEEEDVTRDSTTETFVGLKLFIDQPRWKDVPIYMKTGKSLKTKDAYITVAFKESMKDSGFFGGEIQSNILGIRIQPYEGIYLRFNIKEPGHLNHIVPANTDYCHNCDINYRSPEAYERLLLDGILGDASLFTRWDEVEASWAFVDRLTTLCSKAKRRLTEQYESGSEGPKGFDRMIKRDEKVWWRF